MGNNRSFIREDRGDMLIENMVGITIVAAALLFSLTTFNIMSISSATAAKNQAIVSTVNNELETRLATGNFPEPGDHTPLSLEATAGTIWTATDNASNNIPVTKVSISVATSGADPSLCTPGNNAADCLTITGTAVQDTGAQGKYLPATTNQGSDQFTVAIPAGTKTVFYAIKMTGTVRVSTLTATAYAGPTIIAAENQTGTTKWNNGRITLDPSKGVTSIGFKNSSTSGRLSESNMVVIAVGATP